MKPTFSVSRTKVMRVALRVAAEAVVEALAVIDMEAGRLFLVERARRPHVALALVRLALVPATLRPTTWESEIRVRSSSRKPGGRLMDRISGLTAGKSRGRGSPVPGRLDFRPCGTGRTAAKRATRAGRHLPAGQCAGAGSKRLVAPDTAVPGRAAGWGGARTTEPPPAGTGRRFGHPRAMLVFHRGLAAKKRGARPEPPRPRPGARPARVAPGRGRRWARCGRQPRATTAFIAVSISWTAVRAIERNTMISIAPSPARRIDRHHVAKRRARGMALGEDRGPQVDRHQPGEHVARRRGRRAAASPSRRSGRSARRGRPAPRGRRRSGRPGPARSRRSRPAGSAST